MPNISNLIERKFIDSIDLTNLEIETDSGWQPLTAIHKTIPYTVWEIEVESGLSLRCADTHIVFDQNMNEVFAKDLIAGESYIITINGPEPVIKVTEHCEEEQMFDLTVDHPDHRFYSNSILSHNTSIINALSYALFGSALTNIKKNNLINKSNGKHMMVTVDFEKDGIRYRLERGRSPNILRFYISGNEQQIDDESQGDSRQTQQHVERILGMSHDMFKHIVALNTYTEPFLSMRSNDQRAIIEQLLGITLLSEKAEALKELSKSTRDEITAEEYRIKAVLDANARIESQIKSLKQKQTLWLNKKSKDIEQIASKIESLANVDIDKEIALHKAIEAWLPKFREYSDAQDQLSQAQKDLSSAQSHVKRESSTLKKIDDELNLLSEHRCYACGQELHDEQHNIVVEKKKELHKQHSENLSKYRNDEKKLIDLIESLKLKVEKLSVYKNKPGEPVYPTQSEAYEHKNTLDGLASRLEARLVEVDPYSEQIEEMSNTALEPVSYEKLNSLSKLKDHQDFLYKLLTNKDSFIRKRIIEQSLSYLNNRLSYYLDEIGLPHQVVFHNDLSVEITELGRDLDFDNLSRGERNRLILSLSWAFRDVWESLYRPINLLFIDELIDSGLDSIGVENALHILKKMSRDHNKSIWLVSHRDELQGRVNNVLSVTKENGFTSYANDIEVE